MGRGIVTIVVVAAAVASLSAQATTRPAAKPPAQAPANAAKSPGAGPVFVASEALPEPNAVSRSTTRQTHATTASAAVRRALLTFARIACRSAAR